MNRAQAMQQKIFAPAPPNVRKVLFATNIAETSLTVYAVSQLQSELNKSP